MNNLQQLIKKSENRNKLSSFTVSQNSIDNYFNKKEDVEITYCEDDLTKNYVKFVKDVFNGVFGEVKLPQIEALGNTIKANYDDFKKSYKDKKSVIKEVADGVFIHTSMSSTNIKIKIINLAESISADVIWPKDDSDELKHGEILAQDIIQNTDTFKRMYMYQLNRENIENEINKKITPIEFNRFLDDFDSDYHLLFLSTYEEFINKWKNNREKYKTEDYLN